MALVNNKADAAGNVWLRVFGIEPKLTGSVLKLGERFTLAWRQWRKFENTWGYSVEFLRAHFESPCVGPFCSAAENAKLVQLLVHFSFFTQHRTPALSHKINLGSPCAELANDTNGTPQFGRPQDHWPFYKAFPSVISGKKRFSINNPRTECN